MTIRRSMVLTATALALVLAWAVPSRAAHPGSLLTGVRAVVAADDSQLPAAFQSPLSPSSAQGPPAGTPPGQGGTPPGQGGTPPGGGGPPGGTPPGQGGTPPGQGGTIPGTGGQTGNNAAPLPAPLAMGLVLLGTAALGRRRLGL